MHSRSLRHHQRGSSYQSASFSGNYLHLLVMKALMAVVLKLKCVYQPNPFDFVVSMASPLVRLGKQRKPSLNSRDLPGVRIRDCGAIPVWIQQTRVQMFPIRSEVFAHRSLRVSLNEIWPTTIVGTLREGFAALDLHCFFYWALGNLPGVTAILTRTYMHLKIQVAWDFSCSLLISAVLIEPSSTIHTFLSF